MRGQGVAHFPDRREAVHGGCGRNVLFRPLAENAQSLALARRHRHYLRLVSTRE